MLNELRLAELENKIMLAPAPFLFPLTTHLHPQVHKKRLILLEGIYSS